MQLTHDDIKELKKELDDRYVLQSDCDERQREVNKKFANDDKRIELIISEIRANRHEYQRGQKFNNWLTSAVLGVIIAGIIGFIFLQFGG